MMVQKQIAQILIAKASVHLIHQSAYIESGCMWIYPARERVLFYHKKKLHVAYFGTYVAGDS